MKPALAVVFTLVVAVSSFASRLALPEGWFLAGSEPHNYESGVDTAVAAHGGRSAFIAGKPDAHGFGTIMQTFTADAYRGKRVRLTATVRAEDVRGWAGVWMRVDGPGMTPLTFDNMQDRPIKGSSDWTTHSVVLDVPESSAHISFGILLDGEGRAWIDNVQFDVVGDSVPVTGQRKEPKAPRSPRNLDFE